MPLLVEFCARNGGSQQLFRYLGEANPSPAYVLLLLQVEELIAFNFTTFSEDDYTQLESSVRNFRQTAQFRLDSGNVSGIVTLDDVSIDISQLYAISVTISSGIVEQCRKARYFYLAGQLENGLNLEINQDKTAVQGYLASLRLPEDLSRSLDEAERLYRDSKTNFDLKSSMGHLRSFLENLHKAVFPASVAKFGGLAPDSWGKGLAHFRQHQILSEQEEKFAASLYTLISDEGVHPLVAEREYARLFRNVVIEYALLFLKKLEKIGLKPTN